MGGVRGFMVQIPGKLYHSCDSEEAENTLGFRNKCHQIWLLLHGEGTNT